MLARSLSLSLAALVFVSGPERAGAQSPVDRSPTTVPALVSLASDGGPSSSYSGGAAVSRDGRFVAFHSYGDDLVAGDTNGHYDVFVRDRATGTTERVSVASSGAQSNGSSSHPALSEDGRFVAFVSYATNLVAVDVNDEADVFVHDRLTGATTLASRSTAGEQANGRCERASISADGRRVAFQSFATNLAPDANAFKRDAFVHDRLTGETTLVSLGDQGQASAENCDGTLISADGSVVAFTTSADAFVEGDDNASSDVFVRDLAAGTTTRVSVTSTGAQTSYASYLPDVSADGRFVVFQSNGQLTPGDGDFLADVYVHDRVTGSTEAVTAALDGVGDDIGFLHAGVSDDGQRVVFEAVRSEYPFTGVFQTWLHDRGSGHSVQLSQRFGTSGDGDSIEPALSGDGRVVAFESRAANLVFGDDNHADDVFVTLVAR